MITTNNDSVEIKGYNFKDVFDLFIDSISEFKGRDISKNDIKKKIITNRDLMNNLIRMKELDHEKAMKESSMIKMVYIFGIFGSCPGNKVRVKYLDNEEDMIIDNMRSKKDVFNRFTESFMQINDDVELLIKRSTTIFLSRCSDGSKVVMNGIEFTNKLIKNYNFYEL